MGNDFPIVDQVNLMPKLTILTPTYNRAHLLDRVCTSITLQHPDLLRALEWLIVDDGSTDDTSIKITQLSDTAPFRIRVLHIPHGGKHRALNAGFVEARADWITVIDSDDWFTEGALSKLNHVTQNETTDHVGIIFNPVTVWQRNKTYAFQTPDRITTFLDRENGEPAFDCTLTFRKEAVIAHAFPEIPSEQFLAEAWLLHEVGRHWDVYLSNKILACAQYQPDGLSANILEKRVTAPVGACLAYSTALKTPLRFWLYARAAGNFGRFWWHALLCKRTFIPIDSMTKLLCLGPGICFAVIDWITLRMRKR